MVPEFCQHMADGLAGEGPTPDMGPSSAGNPGRRPLQDLTNG